MTDDERKQRRIAELEGDLERAEAERRLEAKVDEAVLRVADAHRDRLRDLVGDDRFAEARPTQYALHRDTGEIEMVTGVGDLRYTEVQGRWVVQRPWANDPGRLEWAFADEHGDPVEPWELLPPDLGYFNVN